MDDDLARKHGKVKPEKSDQDKRGEISLDLHTCKNIMGKMEPERRTLELLRPRTGVELPGQPRLPNREMRPITIGGSWYADARDLGDKIVFLQAVVGIKSYTTSQVNLSSGNWDITNGMARRRGGEVEQQTTQTVRS